jgi:choline dehydrogenase-like flavoprotein
VIDAESLEAFEVEARIVFLCASALESTRILLNSGFGNSSGELGRNLMDHIMGGGARGIIPGFENQATFGRRPNGIYVPRYRNVGARHPDLLRGYGFQGGAGRSFWGRGGGTDGFGAEYKRRLLTEMTPWSMTFYGFGEMLPDPANYVELDAAVRDRWGIPALRVVCAYGENERKLMDDMALTAAEMLEAAGARDIQPFKEDNPPGLVIHEMGTARMGRDPRSSVLNAWNQVWDAPNVFVTDGACMTSSANQNPSITYMALTARAAARARELVSRREL